MTTLELIHHIFPWEMAPGVPSDGLRLDVDAQECHAEPTHVSSAPPAADAVLGSRQAV